MASARNPNRLRAAIRQIFFGRDRSHAVAACTGVAVLTMASGSGALTLGEVNVRSALGEPLRATIPVRLADGEALVAGCIDSNSASPELQALPNPRVVTPASDRTGVHRLRITTTKPLLEPMYELSLRVRCPGAPAVVRQYVLMLDLPALSAPVTSGKSVPLTAAPVAENTTVAVSAAASREGTEPASDTAVVEDSAGAPQSVAQAPRRAQARSLDANREPIAIGSVYRVSSGDTLSTIAARVSNRDVGIWQMADRIFAANPDAFIRGNPDLIRLASEITIPANDVAPASFAADRSDVAQAPPVPSPAPSAQPAPEAVALPEERTSTAANVGSSPATEPAATPAPEPVIEPTATTTPEAAIEPTVTSATDTASEVEQTAPPIATAPTAVARSEQPPVAAAAESAPNPLLAGLAGALVGLLISGLLWFLSRRSRQPAPAAPAEAARERETRQPARAPVQPVTVRPVQPGFSVSYSDAEPELSASMPAAGHTPAKAVAAPAPADDITGELEQLFDDPEPETESATDAWEAPELDAANAIAEPAAAAPRVSQPAAAEATVQLSIDDFVLDDNDPTMLAGDVDDIIAMNNPTVEVPTPPERSRPLELKALAKSGARDETGTQTLLDALTLLEKDYEEELTLSQMLDPETVKAALARDGVKVDLEDDKTLAATPSWRKRSG